MYIQIYIYIYTLYVYIYIQYVDTASSALSVDCDVGAAHVWDQRIPVRVPAGMVGVQHRALGKR